MTEMKIEFNHSDEWYKRLDQYEDGDMVVGEVPPTIPDYRKDLAENVCRVLFKKKDGTDRVMYATLMESYIHAFDLAPKGTGKPLGDDSPMIKVVDTEINEWRMINKSTICEFSVVEDGFWEKSRGEIEREGWDLDLSPDVS